MAQTGRAYDFSPEVLQEIETLAAQGLTQEQIAHCIDLHPSTLSEKKSEIPEVAEAIKKGRSVGVHKVSNALFNKAMDGDTTSMIFYLKNRDPENWKDRTHQDVKMDLTAHEQWQENLPEDPDNWEPDDSSAEDQ